MNECRCPICGEMSDGSVGPATRYRTPLCPLCRTKVDNEVMQQCVAQSRQMDRVLDLLNPRTIIEMEGVQ